MKEKRQKKAIKRDVFTFCGVNVDRIDTDSLLNRVLLNLY